MVPQQIPGNGPALIVNQAKIKFEILKNLIQKIRESIAVKWMLLYYTFFFLYGGYMLLQIVSTALALIFLNDAGKSIDLHGLNITIDGVQHQIWDLPEFYIATIVSSSIIGIMILMTTKLIVYQDVYGFLGFKRIKKEHYTWLVYSALVLTAGTFLLELLAIHPTVLITADTPLKKSLLIIGMILFAPVFEELLFRGFLLSRMTILLSPKNHWIAVVITALLFAVLHLQYNTVIMIYIFCIGLFLSIMKLKTGNLWLPILFHVVGNLIAALPILMN